MHLSTIALFTLGGISAAISFKEYRQQCLGESSENNAKRLFCCTDTPTSPTGFMGVGCISALPLFIYIFLKHKVYQYIYIRRTDRAKAVK